MSDRPTDNSDHTLKPQDFATADFPPPVPLAHADTLVGQVTASGPAYTSFNAPGYEILAPLGRGASGVVYKAKQTKLKRTVALKVLVGYAHESSEQLARFKDEAVIAAQIQHPNVIQIYDIGESNGVPFLACEYADGGTLESKLRATGPMNVIEAVRLVYQIARGVGAAHSRGVVHRDLKPANILLTSDGVPKVADFGLAKVLGAESNTVTGSILGTPAYMSPEQASGYVRRISPQTDVYALGVILYECLLGVVPHQGDSVMETLDKVRTHPPPALRFRRNEIPDALEEVVLRCLRKIPSERYATADALADDLQRLTAPPKPPPKPPVQSGGGVYYVLTAVTLLAAAALAVWLFGPWSRPPEQPPAWTEPTPTTASGDTP
jgi:eukaryotic-like serine/threonine-protein kinase